MPITIRFYSPNDIDALMDLFVRSVTGIASKDYSPEQIAAWTSQRLDRDKWLARRGNRPTYVAVIGRKIAGFGDLEADGHIDMLFVHPDHQRKGVATALLQHIEAQAQKQGVKRLFTEASVTARPVFERFGFRVDVAQEVAIGGQMLRNFQMSKLFAEG